MKIALYVFLSLLLLLIGFFAWFFLSFAAVPTLVIPEQTTEAERIRLVDAYLGQLQQEGKFNGAILLARGGRPLLMKTYGFTDQHLTTKLTNQSSFRLASVSKQFTAAAILRAQHLRLLNIDEPISTYLPLTYEGVTIRHLLNHTSGIPDVYMKLAEEHRGEIGDTLSISKVVSIMQTYRPTATRLPGATFEYSNTNYVLLAAIIEAVSGRSFEVFLQEELFLPLGMKNSRVWNLLSNTPTFPNKTSSFALFAGAAKPETPTWLDGVAGDGAVFASIEDFLLWDRFWQKNDLIPPQLMQQAFQKVSMNDGTISNYGFGWVLNETGGHWHNGAWLGARTIIARNPESEFLFVLLDNSLNIRFDDIYQEINHAFPLQD